jgi:hypothetical protein
VAPVLAVVLGFLGAPFTDLSFVLQRDEIASVLFDLVTIRATICAAIAAVMDCERSDRKSCQ